MSAPTYVPAALADLESRAGASDTDRPAWLAERLHSATATGVRDVWLRVATGESLEDAADAVARERLAQRDGTGPEARWGHEREPVLVASIQGMRAESRVFHHRTNSRWMFSPDGVAFDWEEQLVLAEVKTGKPEFFGLEAMQSKGYHVQIAWGLFIAGAVLCEYRFEERLGSRSKGFEPGRVFDYSIRWVDVAEMVHEVLVPMADALLEAIDRLLDDGLDKPIEREDIDLEAVRYLHALGAEKVTAAALKVAQDAKKSATAAKEAAFAKVRELAGAGKFQQESLLARVTKGADKTEPGTDRVVDVEHDEVVAARAAVVDAQVALAAIEEKHTTVQNVTVTTKGRLTITSPQKRKVQG